MMNTDLQSIMQKISVVISTVISLIYLLVGNYFFLPAWTFASLGTWIFVLSILILWVIVFACSCSALDDDNEIVIKAAMVPIVGSVVLVVFLIVGSLSSGKLFNSYQYAELLEHSGSFTEKTQQDFIVDFEETNSISNIALMDTKAASILGARQLGQLSDVVSQYEDSNSYNTICLNGKPMKVSALGYAGFFEWNRNQSNGVPGIIIVDPVTQKATYQKLEKAMTYVPSAYLGQDLLRHVHSNYPSKMFYSSWLELDEDGNAFYILPTYKHTIGLFGGSKVEGIIICDPCSGNCEYYAVDEVPEWVDSVYSAETLEDLYNLKGKFSNGYWNFSNVGRSKTTDDYGYIVKDGDTWIFTGVTSYVSNGSDESNIAFVMMNQRTAETWYYQIAGAEEFSAMGAAEGQVANYGYKASFPSLVNIQGEPTYVMVLRDDSYLTKGYALVNMSQYSIVGTGTTQKNAIEAYKSALNGGENTGFYGSSGTSGNGQTVTDTESVEDTSTWTDRKIIVQKIQTADISGNTYYYLTDESGQVYELRFSDNKRLLSVKEQDEVSLLIPQDTAGEYILKSFMK